MKKNILLTIAAATSITMVSCGGGEQKSNDSAMSEESKTEMKESADWAIQTGESTVRWEGGTAGAKVYSHFGTIQIKEGNLSTKGEMITDGSFTIDMSTIAPKDENYGEENPKEKLVGHLSSDDFFAVEKHPTATFKIKSVSGNTLTGDLTIRGKTNEETVEIAAMETKDGVMRAKGKLTFDRQKYDVAWEHFMEDVVLSDNIELDIELVAKKS